MTVKRRKNYKIGNVYAIPLPNGKYAFGRAFEDAGFGVYTHIGTHMDDLPESEEYQFIVGISRWSLKLWTIVDHRPFKTEEEKWPPPTYILDSISGEYSIYHKGETTPATREECIGMDVTAVYDDCHIIDRIMGTGKWPVEILQP
ncbi:Imm26 family immunity protein [Oceanirhabdus sp. W0125-5]|uniref:Imm26 family immunity protein n=1 Tax=Oceanirhabdus sp. W0125-5 TaxID=2999116 RepID=UPI0022F2DC97|nr:Imm26 family immunity protein [Oceanirhabdus sp. W0125-5]WBW96026.1 Imm26 family immunity protein [Oceanirhabdus sp. W0125-5]